MDLGQQVGPLPLGAWAALVAGGLGIAFFAATRQKADATAVAPPGRNVDSDPGVGEGFAGFVNAVELPPADTTKAAPVNNEEWGRAAINYLIAQGYEAGVADNAVRKYLGVQQLSAQEFALINIALQYLGAPPAPLFGESPKPNTPPVVIPPPVVKPPPPPATKPYKIHIVTPWNTKGSTLFGIAQIYYHDGNKWPLIFAANKKGITRIDGAPGFISNPNYLRVGDRVLVP